MNKVAIVLLSVFIVGALASTSPQLEDGVYILTDSNFKDFIASKPFVLVEFYAPWCGHCKKLAPEYVKAAAALQAEGVNAVLAKVDATVEKESAGLFSIQGFPTLKFFSGSVQDPVDFNGRTSTDIVKQIKKITSTETEILSTDEALTAFLAKNQVAIVYFGVSENEATHSTFKSLSMSYDELAFARVFSPELRVAQDASSVNFVLYKQFDEKRNDFTGAVTLASLKEWVDDKSYPIVMPFNDRAIKKVFQQSNPTLFLFANDNEASIAAEAAFAQAAKDNKGKVVFSISKPEDGFSHYQRLADYVGVKTANAPVLLLVHAKGEVSKYQFPSSTITVETVTSFVNDFKADKLKVYLKSEEIPAKNDEPVKVIVGQSFDDIVRNTTADVLVEFYAPWCGHCKQLAPIYEAVAKKLANNKNIVLAKVDATANEVPGVSIKGYPTLKFFLNGKKNQPVDFEGDRTEEGILKYLKEKTSHPWVEAKEDL